MWSWVGCLPIPVLIADRAAKHALSFAARAIPGADGAGVTLLRRDRTGRLVEALAASDPFVTAIDQIQYGTLNEGPYITAARERQTVRSGSPGGETTWFTTRRS